MAEPLSTDLRRRVVDAVKGGMSRRQAAAHFKVGASSAIRWVARSLTTGDISPKRQGGDRRSKAIKAQADFILSLLGPEGDATLAEMQAALAAAGHSFSISALSPVSLLRPKTHNAQKKSAHAAEQDRPDILKRRQAWFESQLDLDPEKLVFIDETWASTNMARRYGRAPKGERRRAAIPYGHWKTTTFVAGLRLKGIAAPLVFDGPINAQVFDGR
jgi:transposase